MTRPVETATPGRLVIRQMGSVCPAVLQGGQEAYVLLVCIIAFLHSGLLITTLLQSQNMNSEPLLRANGVL